MAQATIRDEIWSWTLTKTHRAGDVVRVVDVIEQVGCSERVARDVLNLMAGASFLLKEAMPDGSVRYRAEDDGL